MGVAKVIELIGSSELGFDDAVKNAVREASKTVREIKEVWVKNLSALVDEDKITEYRANVKITFVVESSRLKKQSSRKGKIS